MKWNAAHKISTVVVLALAVTVAGQAHAVCGPSQITNHEDADCLRADWDTSSSPSILNPIPVTTQNLCSDIGKVVAKIDMDLFSSGSIESFRLEALHDGTPNVSYARSKIKGVYCCEDISQICSKSEITAESCLDRFADSSAGHSCKNSSAAVNASYECVITADCDRTYVSGSIYITSSVAVRYGDADNLCNDSGYLKVGCTGSDFDFDFEPDSLPTLPIE